MSDAARQSFAQHLAAAVGAAGAELDADAIVELLSVPPNRDLGDLAFPCFVLARQLRQAPPKIAAALVEALQPAIADDPVFSAVVATGPYVNVKLDPAGRARGVLSAAVTDTWGRGDEGAGKTMAMDFSSPNIAKPFGIGHLRSTAIGHALGNLYTQLGWRVVGYNHLGDWGTQFGKLMAAFELWGDEAKLDADPIQHLYELYVQFHKDAESDPSLIEQGRAWFKRLEEGDEAAHAYWTRFRDLSLREFQRIYDRLGVSFDYFQGEAFYNDMLDDVTAEVEGAGITTVSEGALVVPLDDLDMPPCLIRKSDGATLYATRDIAAAKVRLEQTGYDRFLYVVGVGQTVHFRQVFAVLERMGHAWADRLVHVPFGLIQGISTRKGTLVFLEDILDRGRDLAREIVDDRPHLTDEEKDRIAEQAAIGAVVFQDLSRNRIKDYEFDWDQMLRGLRPGEPGRTGPYLQYTNVRLNSVLDEYADRVGDRPDPADVDFATLEDADGAVIAELEKYPTVIRRAVADDEPSVLTRYLLDLAAAFNAFYSGGHRILSDDAALSAARITLVAAVQNTLDRGLAILGIPRPERM